MTVDDVLIVATNIDLIRETRELRLAVFEAGGALSQSNMLEYST